ncbi:MAG: DUF1150 domain-containing protein [Hyphomicrobiales bacterium]|nr:DUF1150 domain-containing protein [Hyphomicrobiales bacterium]
MENDQRQVISTEILAGLGGGKIAYVRSFRSEEAKDLFPQLPPVAPNLELWALLGADGTPIMLADSRDAVVMNAHQNDLEMVSIH